MRASCTVHIPVLNLLIVCSEIKSQTACMCIRVHLLRACPPVGTSPHRRGRIITYLYRPSRRKKAQSSRHFICYDPHANRTRCRRGVCCGNAHSSASADTRLETNTFVAISRFLCRWCVAHKPVRARKCRRYR